VTLSVVTINGIPYAHPKLKYIVFWINYQLLIVINIVLMVGVIINPVWIKYVLLIIIVVLKIGILIVLYILCSIAVLLFLCDFTIDFFKS